MTTGIEFSSHLSCISKLSPVISHWLCPNVPRITSPNTARDGSLRQTGKYCELNWGRCEVLCCQSGNCLFKMTVGVCWPALILDKYVPVSWDGMLYFCREGERVTHRGTYRWNCFIAVLLFCSIRLLPERITPCSLSTHQVQHCLMKTSTAPSAVAFRDALSLQKYKLVLVLTIEKAGTVPHQVNVFTLRFAGLTYQATVKDIAKSPLSPGSAYSISHLNLV